MLQLLQLVTFINERNQVFTDTIHKRWVVRRVIDPRLMQYMERDVSRVKIMSGNVTISITFISI